MKKKILFFHFDLGGGGAEKVLVNLLNNLNPDKYDITLYTVFNSGVYKDSLREHIKRKTIFNKQFKGFITMAKLLSPGLLHKLFIREKYDIEIGFYHRFPARVIGGCKDKETKTFAWVHSKMVSPKHFFTSYRSLKEANKIYHSFDRVAFVAESAKDEFLKQTGWNDIDCQVVHNVMDINDIVSQSQQEIEIKLDKDILNLCSVGRLTDLKGYDRLLKSFASLAKEGYTDWHFYLLGKGEEEACLRQLVKDFDLDSNVTFLGFNTNPYKYVSKMDLFVCSSLVEGYSTAVAESVVVGVPVLTTNCSGMHEILGDEAGLIVDNSLEGLTDGLKTVFSDRNKISVLRAGVKSRQNMFSTEYSVKEFERFIGIE